MPSAKNALSFCGLKFSNGNTAMLFSSGSAAADFCLEYNQMLESGDTKQKDGDRNCQIYTAETSS